MSTPSTRAGLLRGALIGCCSALVTAFAHAAGGGGNPTGSALVALVGVCALVGMSVGTVNLGGRHGRVKLAIAAMCAAQLLGHLVLTVVGGHHHSGGLLSTPMLALHVIAAVVLGLLIGAVEYLYVVCSSVLSWLRLFATDVYTPSIASARRHSNIVVVEPALLRAGLGMRAPPTPLASVI